jgi:microsomal dipeptidase-like Zn-dependent dipeptidase
MPARRPVASSSISTPDRPNPVPSTVRLPPFLPTSRGRRSKNWPHHQSLTHERSHYRWIERAWRGGLPLYVNLMVENRVLCEVYPYKQNPCHDRQRAAQDQADPLAALQDYIEAQGGAPGKGWYRIVRNPFQTRRVINQGKLAVVMGMEVSEPFDCRLQFDMPTWASKPGALRRHVGLK